MSSLMSSLSSLRSSLTPLLTTSSFASSGVLTPSEFVTSGDNLVNSCGTWQWSSASGKGKAADYLPPEKQYLITRGVTCDEKPSNVVRMKEEDGWMVRDDGDVEDEGWEDGDIKVKADDGDDEDNGADDSAVEKVKADNVVNGIDNEGNEGNEGNDDDDDDDDSSTSSFVDPSILQVGTTSLPPPPPSRTYDMMLTYDRYYRVPRVWLLGYDQSRNLLGIKMMDDVNEDYRNTTCTIERFPFMESTRALSVHPCKHAKVMKNIIDNVGGNVEEYMFVFLKFVQGIVPGVNYDFTV